jgi:predicted O-linked N-acetylglucosamine transferase (SPINDLY family)
MTPRFRKRGAGGEDQREDEFARAAHSYQRGDQAAAVDECRRILSRDPNHSGARYLLGVIELQNGRPAQALPLIARAIESGAGQADAHANLGAALLALGRAEEALASFERALQLNEKFGLAWTNRGNALLSLKRPEDAVSSYRTALACDPGDARAHCNLGNAQQELGRMDEALASYRRAWTLKPDYALAWRNGGNLLKQLHRPQEALACFERVARILPKDTQALTACGNLLLGLSRPDAAAAYFDKALALDPKLLEALNNRGIALMALDDPAAALLCFDRALALSAQLAEAWSNRGEALRRLHQYADAAKSYARLLEIAPQTELARGKLLGTKLLACDWSDHESQRSELARRVVGGERACAPFEFLAVSGSPPEQLACARAYCAQIRPALGTDATPRWQGPAHDGGKIRLAYVSGDFGNRPVSHLLAGVIEQHDRARFETIAVSLRPEDPSETGQRIKRGFNRFIDVSRRSDREVVELMRELDIHVAIDLMGYTHGARPAIFGARAARIQISYLGMPATTGSGWIDYLIADDFVIPEATRGHYSEKIIALPHCFQPNDDGRAVAAAPTRAEMGLPDQGFVFCCFNNSYKINPPVFDIWCRCLSARPGSVLWLVADAPEVETNLRREAERRGVDAQRIVFADRVPYAAHIGRQVLADLFLDTLPFNAGATASDALWAGLPVLTCAGDAFVSRMAGSLLRAIGLPELVTTSLEAYEQCALQLSAGGPELASLRARLGSACANRPLFDARRFCRQLEAAYGEVWERHRQGLEPADLALDDERGA